MFDPSTATGEELCERRLALEHERRVRDAETVRVEAELDRQATTDLEFGLGTGSWIAARKDLPVGLCRYRVRLSNKLVARFEATLAALEAGLISWDHVKVICEAANPRIVDKIAAVQQLLIDEARGQTFNRWKSFVVHLAERLDVEGGYDPVRDRSGTAYCSPIIDGMVNLFANLTPAQALTVVTELERVTDQLYQQAVRDNKECPEIPIPDRAELRAQAMTEVYRRSASRNLADTSPPRPEFVVVLHPDQKNDDAVTAGDEAPFDVAEWVRSGAGGPADANRPTGPEGAPDTVSGDCPSDPSDAECSPRDAGAGSRGVQGGGGYPSWPRGFRGRAETPDGVPIKPDLLRDLCPGAVWRAMWLDQTGVPLNLGRTKRLASPAQRTALAVRDGGCVFPGCDRLIAWCDAHHVDEWDVAAGDTNLPVLVLLCRHHHGVTHRTGWSMSAHPDQTFTWTTPAGATLYSQRHHRQRRSEPSGAAAA